jgi:hypothetical protein
MRGLLLCAALLLVAGSASAETREITGETLVFTQSSSSDVSIDTDPGLTGRVRIGGADDLGCLSILSGSAAIISTKTCDISLHIDVPAGMPLTITQSADGDITLGNTDAPVILTLNGSGDVKAGHTGPLILAQHGSADLSLGEVSGSATLDMTGSGDVRIKALTGPLTIKHQGSGDVAIGRIESPVATIESSGSGDKLLGGGHIENLLVRMSGDGDLAVAADVHDANVSASGGGDVKLGKVTGNISRDASGGSNIIVGGPDFVNATISRVAGAISDGKDVGARTGSSLPGHIVTFAVLAVLAFIGYRIVQRGRLRRPVVTDGAPAAPLHPGVAAVCETLKRVEERLGRVESYVTSREFDLQQKFKKL